MIATGLYNMHNHSTTPITGVAWGGMARGRGHPDVKSAREERKGDGIPINVDANYWGLAVLQAPVEEWRQETGLCHPLFVHLVPCPSTAYPAEKSINHSPMGEHPSKSNSGSVICQISLDLCKVLFSLSF